MGEQKKGGGGNIGIAVLVLGSVGIYFLYASVHQDKQDASKHTGTSTARTEGGVKVVRAPGPMFCGNNRGACELTMEDCTRRFGQCSRADDYSCMTFTTRTSDTQILECHPTYGECKRREDKARTDPELKSVDAPCVILRKDG